jgi:hypothetical protein
MEAAGGKGKGRGENQKVSGERGDSNEGEAGVEGGKG